jgi:hypothetical protein
MGLMKSWSLTFATQKLFRCSGSELFDTFKNIFSLEYFHYKIFIPEKCLENENYKFQENVSRPGIIDARARYRAAARWLRNTGLKGQRALQDYDLLHDDNPDYLGVLQGRKDRLIEI